MSSERVSAVEYSSFVGTTYLNEHFRMEIDPTFAALYDSFTGDILVEQMYWSVDMRVGDGWTSLNWNSTPALTQEDVGEYHRVAVRGVMGIMDERVAVGIYFDGKLIDVPSMGPKISVDLQSISGFGIFRVIWRSSGVIPNLFQFQNRTGSSRILVDVQVKLPGYLSHPSVGENSIVALAPDGRAIRFGLNWQDAIQHYQGTVLFDSSGRTELGVYFGDFSLRVGDRVLLDPIVEGGGGGGGGAPTVSITNVKVERNSLSGTDATITWSTSPSGACDKLEWGYTTTYGNTIYLSCGTHRASLQLLNHGGYSFRITSSASGYNSGIYTAWFRTADVSRSYVYENYKQVYTYQCPTGAPNCLSQCHGTTLTYYPRAIMTGDVLHRYTTTNTLDWTPHYVHAHIDAVGQGCNWAVGLGMRHVLVRLFVKQLGQPEFQPISNSNLWITGQDVRPRTVNELQAGQISWTINAGLQYGGIGFGVSAGINGAVWTYDKGWPNTFPDLNAPNDLYAGYVEIEWNPTATNGLDVIFQLKVNDVLAQRNYLSWVTFRVEFLITVTPTGWGIWGDGGQVLCNSSLNGRCMTFQIVLGDGYIWDGLSTGSADQYTDVQDGTQTLSGFT